jgi:hypothetical protein
MFRDRGVVNGDDHHGGRLDDIGQLTHPHREKLSLQVLYPLAGEERDSDKRTMGGNNLRSDMSEKNYRCRTYTPGGRRGTGLRQKDDGVGLTSRPQGLAGRMRSTSRRNYRCRTYTPPAGEETGLRLRTMGVASRISISIDLNASRKNIAAGPIPPAPARNRSISERTMEGPGSRHRREIREAIDSSP